MEKNVDKDHYLKSVKVGLEHKTVEGQIKLHAYCVMSNHSHEVIRYIGKAAKLSQFMKIAHSRFGQIYNRIHKRQGPVAYDRPKTPVVQENELHQMRVQFYVEANPLRAKMVKDLKQYKYSSFRFYAWGIKDEFSEKLSVPDWYMQLGKTPEQRQSKYRSLFNKYLKDNLIKCFQYLHRYIGEPNWCSEMLREFRKAIQRYKICAPPDEEPFMDDEDCRV